LCQEIEGDRREDRVKPCLAVAVDTVTFILGRTQRLETANVRLDTIGSLFGKRWVRWEVRVPEGLSGGVP
jgi:hypothetical protein